MYNNFICLSHHALVTMSMTNTWLETITVSCTPCNFSNIVNGQFPPRHLLQCTTGNQHWWVHHGTALSASCGGELDLGHVHSMTWCVYSVYPGWTQVANHVVWLQHWSTYVGFHAKTRFRPILQFSQEGEFRNLWEASASFSAHSQYEHYTASLRCSLFFCLRVSLSTGDFWATVPKIRLQEWVTIDR